MKKIRKKLESDVIVDFRFIDEVREDKDKIKQLKRSINILESNQK